jgi:hypothetical protein
VIEVDPVPIVAEKSKNSTPDVDVVLRIVTIAVTFVEPFIVQQKKTGRPVRLN